MSPAGSVRPPAPVDGPKRAIIAAHEHAFPMPDPLAMAPPTDWLRLALLYSHLLLCAFALVEVLRADVRIVAARFTVDGLRRTAHRVAWVLCALWASGLAIVFLDTGFDPGALGATPKLLLKLLTVSVLTANGVVLHWLSFPIVAARVRPTVSQALLLALSGALSTSHWLLAAFVGVARPLGQWPLETLLTAYLAYVGATLAVATLAAPALRRLLPDGLRRPSAHAREDGPDGIEWLMEPAVHIRL